ncbi:disease resistance protein, partial [Striga asiatica]
MVSLDSSSPHLAYIVMRAFMTGKIDSRPLLSTYACINFPCSNAQIEVQAWSTLTMVTELGNTASASFASNISRKKFNASEGFPFFAKQVMMAVQETRFLTGMGEKTRSALSTKPNFAYVSTSVVVIWTLGPEPLAHGLLRIKHDKSRSRRIWFCGEFRRTLCGRVGWSSALNTCRSASWRGKGPDLSQGLNRGVFSGSGGGRRRRAAGGENAVALVVGERLSSVNLEHCEAVLLRHVGQMP